MGPYTCSEMCVDSHRGGGRHGKGKNTGTGGFYFITPEIAVVPPSLFPHSQRIHEHNVLVTTQKSHRCVFEDIGK